MDYAKVKKYRSLELYVQYNIYILYNLSFILIHKQMLKQIYHWTDYLFIYLLLMLFLESILRFSEAFFPYQFSETS